MILRIYLLAVTCAAFSSCAESEGPGDTLVCGVPVVVNDQLYDELKSDPHEISDVTIDGDCLQMTLTASGCDGDTWEMMLIGSSMVAESLPEQRYLRLSFRQTEACLAVISKEVKFDITPFQIQNEGVLIIHIQGYEETIRYDYSM